MILWWCEQLQSIDIIKHKRCYHHTAIQLDFLIISQVFYNHLVEKLVPSTHETIKVDLSYSETYDQMAATGNVHELL